MNESKLLEECEPILAKSIEPNDVVWIPFHESFCEVEVIVKDKISITLMFTDQTNYITVPSQVFLKKNHE